LRRGREVEKRRGVEGVVGWGLDRHVCWRTGGLLAELSEVGFGSRTCGP